MNTNYSKKINEAIGAYAATIGDYAAMTLIKLLDADSRSRQYFLKNKIAAFDNNDEQLKKEEAAKRQRELEEYIDQTYKKQKAKLAAEKEIAAKEPRLAMRLALPPSVAIYGKLPHSDNFLFVTIEKIGQLENVYTSSKDLYPNKPFNIFTVYGPLSQLQKVFDKFGKKYFAYNSKGNKVNPNAQSLDKCLVDANGNDLTFYKKA